MNKKETSPVYSHTVTTSQTTEFGGLCLERVQRQFFKDNKLVREHTASYLNETEIDSYDVRKSGNEITIVITTLENEASEPKLTTPSYRAKSVDSVDEECYTQGKKRPVHDDDVDDEM